MPLRWDRLVRHARKHRTANAPGALVAALEPRRLLAAVAWDGGGDGLRWGDNRNWSGDRVPPIDR